MSQDLASHAKQRTRQAEKRRVVSNAWSGPSTQNGPASGCQRYPKLSAQATTGSPAARTSKSSRKSINTKGRDSKLAKARMQLQESASLDREPSNEVDDAHVPLIYTPVEDESPADALVTQMSAPEKSPARQSQSRKRKQSSSADVGQKPSSQSPPDCITDKPRSPGKQRSTSSRVLEAISRSNSTVIAQQRQTDATTATSQTLAHPANPQLSRFDHAGTDTAPTSSHPTIHQLHESWAQQAADTCAHRTHAQSATGFSTSLQPQLGSLIQLLQDEPGSPDESQPQLSNHSLHCQNAPDKQSSSLQQQHDQQQYDLRHVEQSLHASQSGSFPDLAAAAQHAITQPQADLQHSADDDPDFQLPKQKRKQSARHKQPVRRHKPRSKQQLSPRQHTTPGPKSHVEWQTLGDVLRDIDINGITFRGTPLRKATAAASPSRAPTPVQFVDTRPLVYLHQLRHQSTFDLATPTVPAPRPDFAGRVLQPHSLHQAHSVQQGFNPHINALQPPSYSTQQAFDRHFARFQPPARQPFQADAPQLEHIRPPTSTFAPEHTQAVPTYPASTPCQAQYQTQDQRQLSEPMPAASAISHSLEMAVDHTPQLQFDRRSPQPDSPTDEAPLAPGEWLDIPPPTAVSLFGSPAESPIMQNSQAVTDSKQELTANSSQCPAASPAQSPPPELQSLQQGSASGAEVMPSPASPILLWDCPPTCTAFLSSQEEVPVATAAASNHPEPSGACSPAPVRINVNATASDTAAATTDRHKPQSSIAQHMDSEECTSQGQGHDSSDSGKAVSSSSTPSLPLSPCDAAQQIAVPDNVRQLVKAALHRAKFQVTERHGLTDIVTSSQWLLSSLEAPTHGASHSTRLKQGRTMSAQLCDEVCQAFGDAHLQADLVMEPADEDLHLTDLPDLTPLTASHNTSQQHTRDSSNQHDVNKARDSKLCAQALHAETGTMAKTPLPAQGSINRAGAAHGKETGKPFRGGQTAASSCKELSCCTQPCRPPAGDTPHTPPPPAKTLLSKKRKIRPVWNQVQLAASSDQVRFKAPAAQNAPAKNGQSRFITLMPPELLAQRLAERQKRLKRPASNAAGNRPGRDPRLRHQQLPASVHTNVQQAFHNALKPKQASVSTSILIDSGSACHRSNVLLESGFHVQPADRDSPKLSSITETSSADACDLAHQQATALLASAQAVLRGLDWADTQLTCSSTSLSLVPAYNSSTASSSLLEQSSADAAPSEAANSAAEAANPKAASHAPYTHTGCQQTEEQQLNVSVTATNTNGDLRGQLPACHGSVQKQGRSVP